MYLTEISALVHQINRINVTQKRSPARLIDVRQTPEFGPACMGHSSIILTYCYQHKTQLIVFYQNIKVP